MVSNNLSVNKIRLLKEFFKMLQIFSPSKHEKEFADYVSQELIKMGISVQRDDCGKYFGGNTGNIIAKFSPKFIKNNPPIFLCAHLDTVMYDGEIIPVEDNGRIINKTGSCILGADDKAAVAAIFEALRIINENEIACGIVYLIFTVGEELALFGSRHIDLSNVEADFGFVFDSDGDIGIIINKAPYHNRINLKVIGKASHAGVSPEKGINSIKSAAEAIYKINSGRIDSETTCNIGIIKGGIETNIVPEITEISAEARSMNEKKLENITFQIINSFKEAASGHGAKLEYDVIREYDGYSIKEDSMIINIAKEAIRKIGLSPVLRSTGGGSDTNNFNSKGKNAVNLSSGIENCHSKDEYIKTEELIKLASLIVEIIRFDKDRQ